MVRRAIAAFALGVFCAGSVLAHQDGAGSHEAWKHDRVAASAALTIQTAANVDSNAVADICSARGEILTFEAMLENWREADEAGEAEPTDLHALTHAWHIEYRKACRDAGFEYD